MVGTLEQALRCSVNQVVPICFAMRCNPFPEATGIGKGLQPYRCAGSKVAKPRCRDLGTRPWVKLEALADPDGIGKRGKGQR